MSLPVSVLPRTVPREREALLLAGLLRSARLTLLCGEAGAGKSVLLETGVMPLLHRRTTDQAVPPGLAPRVVIPFPERRSRVAGGAGRSPEVAILMADWSGEPLVRLQAQLHEALAIAVPQQQTTRVSLAGTLSALNMQFGARFIVLLDRFDDCLAAAQDEWSGARAFLEEFMIAVDRPLLPANFLIAVRNDADPLLDPLRVRLPGFGDQTLRLSRLPTSRVVGPSLRQVPKEAVPAAGSAEGSGVAAGAAPVGAGTPEGSAAADAKAPRAVARQSEEDWLASLNAVVSKAAEAARLDVPGEAEVSKPATPAADLAPLLASQGRSAGSAQAPRKPPLTPRPLPEGAREEERRAAETVRHPQPRVADSGHPQTMAEQAASGLAILPRLDFSMPAMPNVDGAALALPPLPLGEGWGEGKRQTETTALPKAIKPQPSATSPRSLAWIGVPTALALVAWLAWPSGSPTSTPQAAQAPTPALPPPSVVTLGKPDVPVATLPTPAAPAPQASSIPTPTPTSVATPTLTATNDIDDPVRSIVAIELSRAIAATNGAPEPNGGATPPANATATHTWPAGFTPLPNHPGFALARYDALQAARQALPGNALQVVAPLYTEDVLFVAHAGSPLAFIHDIRHARINVGPAQGARAVTAGAVYQRFFGAALPTASADTRGAEAVLGSLASGKSIDVMVVAGPQAAAWWAGLPAETARSLKLLKIDRADPADRSALQTFLPTTVHAGADAGTPTLAVMSFLVAAGTPEATAQIAPAVRSLCGALPALQRDGSPKWREFQPGLQLETGWPNARSAAALRACATPTVVAGGKR